MKRNILMRAMAVVLCLVAGSAGGTAANGGEIVVNDDREKPLKLVLTRPWYRQTIFASMPVDMVEVEAYPSVHINPGLMVHSRLHLRILSEQDEVAVSSTVTNSGPSHLIRAKVSVTNLPPGNYQLEARMFDGNGGLLQSVHGVACVDSVPLRKLPPAPHEVTFDDHGICRVNGEPFFPIGIFHVWPGVFDYMNGVRAEKDLEPLTWEGWFRKLKEAGFNSFNDWQGGREPQTLRSRYDIAERLGFRGQLHPVSDQDLATLSRHGGVLGWYTWDEPMLHGATAESLAERYGHYLALDPYHPQIATDNSPSSVDAIAAYVDVLMPDLYPQHGGDMRIVGRATAYARRSRRGRAPVWPVIQAFQISRYTREVDGSWYPFGRLDADEMRCIVYDAIACGATGIYYYAYYTPEGPQDLPDGTTRKSYIVDDFPDQWEAMHRINHELARIAPAILSGRTLPTSVEPRGTEVHAATFVDEQRAFVLIANPIRTAQQVVIGVPGLGSQNGVDPFTREPLECRHGRLSADLPPLGAAVYAFKLP